MKNKYFIIIAVVVTILLLILTIAINFGFNATLKSERKDKQTMLEELWYKFGVDYRAYQSLPAEEVTITSEDNLQLKGVYHNVFPDSNKVVIINHGYTANRYVAYQFSDVFFEAGYNVLLIDMRSHGASQGDFASYGYYESMDMGLWVEWVKNKVGEDAYIGLHGQSMGAATVMLYGGTHPEEIQFVIEDCGFSTAREAIKFQFKKAKVSFWPLYDLVRLKAKNLYGFDLNEISPLAAISQSTVPTLFIHGTKDDIVPTWMSETLYEAKKGPKDQLYLVEDAGHMESYFKAKENYKDVVTNFLNSLEK